MQRLSLLCISEAQPLYLQQNLWFFLWLWLWSGFKPAGKLADVLFVKHSMIHMGRLLLWRDLDPGISHSGYIQRLTDPILRQKAGGKQFIRMHIRQDLPFIYQNDPVHISPQDILQPVLNDQYCRICLLLDLIDQFDGLFASSRIQIGQRFIK